MTSVLGEARVLLPQVDKRFELALLEYFGGFTRSIATGAWLDEGCEIRETMTVYDVAIQLEQAPDLRFLALRAGKGQKQKAVYYRAPNGVVEIVPCTTPR